MVLLLHLLDRDHRGLHAADQQIVRSAAAPPGRNEEEELQLDAATNRCRMQSEGRTKLEEGVAMTGSGPIGGRS